MAGAARTARGRAKNATKQADNGRSSVEDEVQDVAGDDERQSGSGGGQTITGELKDTFREAAVEVLKPVMRKATMSAAKYAVKEGPSLFKDKIAPKLEEAGGAGELVKGVASKGGGLAESVGGVASGIGGKLTGKKKEGESPSGTGRGRRLPVEESIDVGVDLETAYDQFTQFEDWPKFMHRVERIEQRDEATLMWHENIWGIRRSWEAEITDQVPCERIAWRSKGGTQTIGVVTFHRLSDTLTRILMTVDFQPKGLFEKTASGTRISRRAIKSDLMRFKGFIELRDEATGEWRGRIEDGELADEEPEDERDEDFEDEDVEEQPEGEADDDFEDEEEPEEEPEAEEEDDEPEAEVDESFEDEEEPEAEEEDDEPEAEAEADDDEFDEEDDEEQPRASRRRGKQRPEEDDEEAEQDEEPEEEAPPARSRRKKPAARRKPTARRKATAKGR
jgi:uncharacterized membrane protein